MSIVAATATKENNTGVGGSQQPAYNGTLGELVAQLLPMVLSELNKQSDCSKKNPKHCTCKCAKQVQVLQTNYERLNNSVSGYKAQVENWKEKVLILQQAANESQAAWKREEKRIKISASKIEQFTKTNETMKKTVNMLECNKDVWDSKIKEIKETVDSFPKLSEIEKSQEFLSAEFEKIKAENTSLTGRIRGDLETQIQEVAQNVELNLKKSINNAQYPREECLTISGVSESIEEADHSVDSDTAKVKNNCKESKEAVINLCKELNLVIDPDKISIAHRLKKSKFAKKGPRPIIVKFSNKELCKEVLNLRKACKEISQWAFDKKASKIFINESLTPEKRKLLYETKQSVNKHLTTKHGIIYVWTYRGDVYIRKNADGAPKIRVNSELDLYNIVNGFTSLDVQSDTPLAPNMIRWRHVKNPWGSANSRRPQEYFRY